VGNARAIRIGSGGVGRHGGWAATSIPGVVFTPAGTVFPGAIGYDRQNHLDGDAN
jgi:hypothetical protein